MRVCESFFCEYPPCGTCKSCLAHSATDQREEMRRLLLRCESFIRTLADAGVIALPKELHGALVGILDATAV
jgi:hypothetical protein